MRFFKRLVLSLAVFTLIFSHPGLSSAANPPTIVSGVVEEPIVSSDGNDIQVARVVINVPGRLSEVKSVTIAVSSPDVIGHALGVFTFSGVTGFVEQVGPNTGSEYVNLIPVDVNNPDTSSRVIFDPITRQAEIIFRWTLNDVYGSVFNNDIRVTLKTRPPAVAQMFMLQSVLADEVLIIDSDFDTNSPPDFAAVADVEVLPGVDEIEVVLSATDVDDDPIAYLMISAPSDAVFNVTTFTWLPGEEDIGVHNIQFVATDPYGTTSLDFDVVVEEEPTPETGSWTATATVDAPVGRSGNSVVWTGTESIVWGGSTIAEGIVGSGARYNPTTSTWTATAAPVNSFGATSHSAVWTGTEMLVWGGTTLTGVTNSGQLYNPATDSWREMSTVGAPTARYDAAGVWNGSEFVVWGGVSIDGNGVSTWLDDGARYNPTTDTWETIAASGLAGRQAPGTVALGEQMVVWGGSSWSAIGGNVYYADGAVYTPSTDSWEQINAIGAPAGRVAHAMTSVAAGTFVVWGGANGTFLDSGAIYDTLTDTWTTMALVDAPDARMDMAFAGASGVLSVWGGSGSEGTFATGGVYNQTTNTWLATSSVGVLTGRQLANAVWTGSGMLVWGGLSTGGVREITGGIFTP